MKHAPVAHLIVVIGLLILIGVLAGALAGHGRNATGRWRVAATVTASTWLISGTLLFYYYRTWHSWNGFAEFVDMTCRIPFCDFDVVFYSEGQRILSSAVPVPGYFYSAPFALLLSGFQGIGLSRAVAFWAILEGVMTAALFLVPLLFTPGVRDRSPGRIALYTLSFASATPILHNLKWGQVSALVVLLVLLSLWMAARAWPVAAGALLAAAIAIKYYPVLFLGFFVVRRDWRAVGACAATLALILAITMSVLGVHQTLDFQIRTGSALTSAESTWIATSPESQYVGPVMTRWGGPLHIPATHVWAVLGGIICAVNIGFLWRLRRRPAVELSRWAALLGFTATPFWVVTSWAHYFVYLPALQLFALDDVASRRSGRLNTAWIFVSMASASSVVMLTFAHQWVTYSKEGYLFISNLCLLVYLYLQLGLVRTDEQ